MKNFEFDNRRIVIGGVAVVIVVAYIIRLFTLQMVMKHWKLLMRV